MKAHHKDKLTRVPTGRRRRGVAATEAAVVLPVLLTLTLAAVDFARVFGLSAELSNAVQVGAEYGATHRPSTLAYPSWLSSVQTAVLNELGDSTDFDQGKVNVTVSLLIDSQGNQQVQVQATYPFRTLVQWPLIPTQVPLNSQVTMRQYR